MNDLDEGRHVPDPATVIRDPRWELEITSFRGMSVGAAHYYGKVSRDLYAPAPDGEAHYAYSERFEVAKTLSVAEARALSKADGYTWREGDWSHRLDSREEVIEIARRAFTRVAADGDFLVIPSWSGADEVIAGSADGYSDPAPAGSKRFGHRAPADIVHQVVDGDDAETTR